MAYWDVRAIAIGRSDDVVYVSDGCDVAAFDANTGVKLFIIVTSHSNVVRRISLSLNEEMMMTVSYDKTAKLIDIASRSVIMTFIGHKSSVQCCLFGDGTDVFTCSLDDTIMRWNRLTGECVRTYSGHRDVVFCVLFDPVTKRLFSSSADRTIICWDINSGDMMDVMKDHGGDVYSLAWVNQNMFASASNDCTVKFWSTISFACLKTLKSHTNAILSTSSHLRWRR